MCDWKHKFAAAAGLCFQFPPADLCFQFEISLIVMIRNLAANLCFQKMSENAKSCRAATN